MIFFNLAGAVGFAETFCVNGRRGDLAPIGTHLRRSTALLIAPPIGPHRHDGQDLET